MKKYIYVIIALVVFNSCSDELDLSAPSELSATGFWDTEEAAELRIQGCMRI